MLHRLCVLWMHWCQYRITGAADHNSKHPIMHSARWLSRTGLPLADRVVLKQYVEGLDPSILEEFLAAAEGDLATFRSEAAALVQLAKAQQEERKAEREARKAELEARRIELEETRA